LALQEMMELEKQKQKEARLAKALQLREARIKERNDY